MVIIQLVRFWKRFRYRLYMLLAERRLRRWKAHITNCNCDPWGDCNEGGAGSGPGRIGYKLSEETKNKLREARKRQAPIRHGPEVREKIGNIHKGRVHSEQSRLNMARAHGAKPFVEVTTGQRFESQSHAARTLRVQQTKIGLILAGKRKSIHGYSFRYL